MIATPRKSCRKYIEGKKVRRDRVSLVTRETFKSLSMSRRFRDGPVTEAVDRNHQSLKRPLQRYGILDNGRLVYCELNRVVNEEVRALVEGETTVIPEYVPV